MKSRMASPLMTGSKEVRKGLQVRLSHGHQPSDPYYYDRKHCYESDTVTFDNMKNLYQAVLVTRLFICAQINSWGLLIIIIPQINHLAVKICLD